LALALSVYEPPKPVCGKRCPASPLRRKPCLPTGGASETAADLTVLLSAGRLRDTVSDEPFLRGLPARAALLLLRRARRRAETRQPDIQARVVSELERLHGYERQRLAAVDPPADAFATLLAALADAAPEESGRRVLRHLFYHLGRWIYLMDACDDLKDDAESGAYNPVAARFGLTDGQWTPEARGLAGETAALSRWEMASAVALLPEAPALPVIENIVLQGLPFVEARVLAGTWKTRNRRARDERPV
jgi:hypothetical protein